ncbi:hypothetical protein ACTMTI_50335 [Nonomuraea sp. H19]
MQNVETTTLLAYQNAQRRHVQGILEGLSEREREVLLHVIATPVI